MEKMAKRDYYEVLGVGKSAEKAEIKNVVRNQLKQGFNNALGKPMVEEIYFSQFVVQ